MLHGGNMNCQSGRLNETCDCNSVQEPVARHFALLAVAEQGVCPTSAGMMSLLLPKILAHTLMIAWKTVAMPARPSPLSLFP